MKKNLLYLSALMCLVGSLSGYALDQHEQVEFVVIPEDRAPKKRSREELIQTVLKYTVGIAAISAVVFMVAAYFTKDNTVIAAGIPALVPTDPTLTIATTSEKTTVQETINPVVLPSGTLNSPDSSSSLTTTTTTTTTTLTQQAPQNPGELNTPLIETQETTTVSSQPTVLPVSSQPAPDVHGVIAAGKEILQDKLTNLATLFKSWASTVQPPIDPNN